MPYTGNKFSIEHAIKIHAYSHVIAPAEAIYDSKLRKNYGDVIKNCHIYMIGLMPEITTETFDFSNGNLIIHLEVGGTPETIELPAPEGSSLVNDDDKYCLRTAEGELVWPNNEVIFRYLHEQKKLIFEVQYIGQSYGKNGNRNALERLLKHETLQKISLLGIPEKKRLQLLLLQIQPDNSIMTVINPRAKDDSTSDSRIDAGFQKLHNTSEKERITLFEASLIRYFRPKFNIEFKDSFPSTNMTALNDCYKKDFSAIIAEIAFPDLHLMIGSESVEPTQFHFVKTDLHNDQDRRSFFFGK